MKHRISKRAVLVLALCVACVLGFGVTYARADVDAGMNGNNILKVGVINPTAEIKDAKATKAKVYKIATGTYDAPYDTYHFAFDLPTYQQLANQYNLTDKDDTKWDSMAEAAKAIVIDQGIEPDAEAAIGENITNLADGVYLVLVDDTTSDRYSFTFQSALVALPGKVGTNGSMVTQTWVDGTWTNAMDPIKTVEPQIKWVPTQRYGSLQVNKSVIDSKGNPIKNGEPASFVFHITGEGCDEYVTAQFDGTTVTGGIIGHIPAGIPLTVSEVNSGAAYQVVGESSKPVTVYADTDPAVVEFQNTPNGSGKIGYGVENHYVYDGDDWNVTQRTINASENTTK